MRSLSVYYSNKEDQVSLVSEIKEMCESLGILFVDVCIDDNWNLQERFGDNPPVVLVGSYRLNYPFTLNEVEVAAKSALYQDEMNSIDIDHDKRFIMSKREKFALWFSKSYAWVISVLVLVFLGLAILPPMLAANGKQNAAAIGYKFYSMLCHQLAFRSYFIMGEQYAYPREIAGVGSLKTYEQITGKSAEDIRFARNFIGNAQVGYKLALCERDVAIYAGLGLFGLLYQFTGKRIKHLRWYFWVIVALIPIAIDGGSQLPGLAEGWPAWLPIRESTPLLRSITGALFGLGTAWYVFPMMEESIRETRFSLQRKQHIAQRYANRQ